MQEIISNDYAFQEFMKDRYINGYDGSTEWNSVDYFKKEVTRNENGTFTLSDKIVDDHVAYIKEVLDTRSGYLTINTLGIKNVDPAWFANKQEYDCFKEIINSYDMVFVYQDGFLMRFLNISGYNFVGTSASVTFYKNWALRRGTLISHDVSTHVAEDVEWQYSNYTYKLRMPTVSTRGGDNIYTPNGSTVKIFKSAESMKQYSVGYSPYYSTEKFNKYDYNADNSITNISGDTFTETNWVTNNTTNYENCGNTINNFYDENSGITEEQLQKIIDDLFNKLQDQDPSGGGGSGGGSGDKPNIDFDFGGAMIALLEGFGKVLTFILELFGKVIGLIADFGTKLLGLLDNLTFFTDGMSNFLVGMFPWVPKELWDVIILGMTAIMFIACVKAFKK